MKERSQYKSSSYTATKQTNLARLLETHFRIVQGILKKNVRAVQKYLYYDLTAGCGRNKETNEAGSPVIFLETAKEFSLKYDARFFEIHDETRQDLITNLKPYHEQGHTFNVGIDHHDLALPKNPMTRQYGLVYVDPSNAQIPLDLLKEFNRVYDHIDIVINLACTSQKRASRSKHTETLEEILNQIGKREWIISKPVTAFQWSMMLGTNWTAYPKFERWFYKRSSSEGQYILELLSSTEKERRELNQPLLL